ncbi:uncharacterized protein [Physcomitrium patens]|uniref:Uncharacterized protein n=1 Tax=Physcomitrium patens TaxID=3218 RepID=A0A2K1JPK5_PHYPA|nr:uncharacterized protein LOC112289284 [Physcomitrium patens]PNR43346.1 hypothetical protein PHYPA_015726 [Physcomitrium patens]|eukprot:XP_024390149.1 uncharacterized protein LOC112289284 [Physcomitrella patens]
MAGLALALAADLPAIASKSSLHSFSTISALAATAAASSTVSFLGPPLFAHFIARDWTEHVAYCHATIADADNWEDSVSVPIQRYEAEKKYDIELKPLFSAFRPRAIGATTIRALLVNYLPLLEAYLQPEDDDLEEDRDRPPRPPIDPVVPLKRSVTHILREVSVITTRRVLERIAVHHVTDRMACKLLKDISKSAIRKAGRDLSPVEMFTAVSKTTFRAHALGVFANWMVQLMIDSYRSVRISFMVRSKKGKPMGLEIVELKRLARRTAGNTLKGGASLVFASIGAGLGTILIRPSTGTWIGCAAGDFAGPFLVGLWLDTWIVYDSSPPGSD